MIQYRPKTACAFAALLAAGLSVATAAPADNGMKTVVIEAGVLAHETIGHTDLGAPMEKVTLTHRVSYADLDLATHSGALALEQRVKEAARLACEQLDRLYPLEGKDVSACIRETVEHATPQVDEAISAAGKASETE